MCRPIGNADPFLQIIPSGPKKDGHDADKPLIAMILVSPCGDPNAESPPSPALGGMRTRRQSNATAFDGRVPEPAISHYQTSVEIYSLSTRKRIATLFTSPVIGVPDSNVGPVKPWGGLRIEVAQNTVVLGVGLSGETYVFSCAPPKSISKKRSPSVGGAAKKSPIAKPVVVAPEVVVEAAPVEGEAPVEKVNGKKKKKGRAAPAAPLPPPLILPSSPPVTTKSPPPPPPPEAQTQGLDPSPAWVCLAKVWTGLQFAPPPPAPPANAAFIPPPPPPDPTPIFSLSARHLAFAPLPAGTSTPAGGSIMVPLHPQGVLSINSTSPPHLPKSNVIVDQSGGEGWKGRITREVVSGVIRGAKWIGGEAGRRVMGYWNGPANGQAANGMAQTGYAGSPPQGGFSGDGFGTRYMSTTAMGGTAVQGVSVLGQQLRGERQGLYPSPPSSYDPYVGSPSSTTGLGISPPTPTLTSFYPQHYQQVRAADTAWVSILDLQKPLFSAAVPHWPTAIASWEAPTDLSFLSFAPGGLMLVTASKAGDVIFVWDLMRALRRSSLNTGSGAAASAATGPSASSSIGSAAPTDLSRQVRLLAHFTRLTASYIISVTWNPAPEGSFTVLTEKGTVHFYNLPAESLRWPPPPKRVKTRKGSIVGAGLKSVNRGEVVKEAVRFVGSSAMPLVRAGRESVFPSSSDRTNTSSSIAGSSSSATGTNVAKKKTQAAGSKVSLPGPVSGDSTVRFLVGKESGLVAILGGGLVRVYQLISTSRRKGRKIGVGVGEGVEYTLPALPKGVLNNANAIDDGVEEVAVSGFWSRSQGGPKDVAKSRMPLSYAEIDTNASVRPFHLDRRVVLEVFVSPSAATTPNSRNKKKQVDSGPDLDLQAAEVTTGDWCFGGEIHSRKLNILGKSGGLSVGNGEGGQEGFFEDGCEVLDQLEL